MDSTGRLTVANFHSDYTLLSRSAEGYRLQKELDRIVREQLPRVLAESILPQFDPGYSVYRIRRIEIDLIISCEALKEGLVPRLWARNLLQQLFHEIRFGNPGNVVRFASHADYTAAFISELVRGSAWTSWVYDEFSPLRHLSTGEAIAELLTMRPGYFITVARQANRQKWVEPLLNVLDERQARRILQHVEHAAAPDFEGHELLEIGQKVFASHPVPPASHRTQTHHQLALLLRMTTDRICEKEITAVFQLSRHVAILQRVLSQLPAKERHRLQHLFAKPREKAALPLRGLSEEVMALVLPYHAKPQGQNYLRWLFDQVSRLAPGPLAGQTDDGRFMLWGDDLSAKNVNEPDTVSSNTYPEVIREQRFAPLRDELSARHVNDPDAVGANTYLEAKQKVRVPEEKVTALEACKELNSGFAGCCLVLMSIRDLKLTERLTMVQLRQCMTVLFDGPVRRLCEFDPLWSIMFPVEEASQALPTWPRVDEPMLFGMEKLYREAIARAEGAEAWAGVILSRFSGRLPGLERSSPGYLSRQFLQRSGRIRLTPESLTVSLEVIPLGVVLRMAGFNGLQGRLPWLGQRELVIEIPAG